MATRPGGSMLCDSNEPRGFRWWWKLLHKTGDGWLEDNAPRLGAALAFYAAFSMAPLLVIALSIASAFLPQAAVRDHLQNELSYLLGSRGAEGIRALLDAARLSDQGVWATAISLVMLLIGASGVFGELQDALNTIWQVETKPRRKWWHFIKDRFVSFTLVVGTGFLLMVSLILSTLLSALGKWMSGLLPFPEFVLQCVQFVGSTAVFAFLFALIFKFVPDAKIRWRDVTIGAIVTSLLFVLGKFLIGMYLARAGIVSAYGAAASFAIVLLWLYYSAQILFFGAEFTQAYATQCGSPVAPTPNARFSNLPRA